MNTILISGGTGLIGRRLSYLLKAKGYKIHLLSRECNPKNLFPTFLWNINQYTIDDSAFDGVSHIIHLTGAGVADKRWTNKRKNEILYSRVASTNLLYDTVKRLEVPLKSFVAASATGYYGSTTTDKIFKETNKPGNDFLSNVCKLWEKAINQFEHLKIRTVILRTGIVLSKEGGALKKMTTPVITSIGNGKQFMPWIHIDDLCELYIKGIEDNKFQGVYNAVSTEHITNFSFSKVLSKIVKKPFIPFMAPKVLLKIALGEMSSIILNGNRVSAEKIKQAGFKFKFGNLNKALKNLL